ncbi:hypothetical protein BT69DRAFT_1280366 [Atractiella rhizophila]|nr:hypothetical protein BT69DRAFT_1280366 [Atractiella rhizophila]
MHKFSGGKRGSRGEMYKAALSAWEVAKAEGRDAFGDEPPMTARQEANKPLHDFLRSRSKEIAYEARLKGEEVDGIEARRRARSEWKEKKAKERAGAGRSPGRKNKPKEGWMQGRQARRRQI